MIWYVILNITIVFFIFIFRPITTTTIQPLYCVFYSPLLFIFLTSGYTLGNMLLTMYTWPRMHQDVMSWSQIGNHHHAPALLPLLSFSPHPTTLPGDIYASHTHSVSLSCAVFCKAVIVHDEYPVQKTIAREQLSTILDSDCLWRQLGFFSIGLILFIYSFVYLLMYLFICGKKTKVTTQNLRNKQPDECRSPENKREKIAVYCGRVS